MSNLLIRPAVVDDAEELLEIYRPYVERTAITFEYAVPAVEEFRGRIERTIRRYPYLVAMEGGAAAETRTPNPPLFPGATKAPKSRILGYAYTGPFKEREAYDWAVETSIYVDMNHKKSGVGRALYEALEDVSRRQHIFNLNACIGVPVSADPHLTTNSMDFHAHMGYRLAGRFHRCGYKFGTWYDMVWMEKFLGEHPEAPLPVIPWPELEPKL